MGADLGGIPLSDNCDNGCHKRLGSPNRDIQVERLKITLERAGPRVLVSCREEAESSVGLGASRATYLNGRGERIRADTPSRSLLIPVTNVPTSASSDAAPRFGQHQAVARAFSRPSRIRSRPYSKSSP